MKRGGLVNRDERCEKMKRRREVGNGGKRMKRKSGTAIMTLCPASLFVIIIILGSFGSENEGRKE